MTRDDIIRMAHEAGLHIATDHDWMPIIALAYAQKFAELVAAAERNRTWTQDHWTEYERSIAATEREACIKLLEDFSQTQMVPVLDTWRMGLIAGANAIRARGER
jgi:hypothetical protein